MTSSAACAICGHLRAPAPPFVPLIGLRGRLPGEQAPRFCREQTGRRRLEAAANHVSSKMASAHTAGAAVDPRKAS
ncbi:DUF1427 family protein [Pseudodonghicola sp.]|uniref:DUF1427 family protein n=1 Tax=Pseudodonghicola sp. TaxID=1969463 RepID=UPI003A973455